MMSDRPDQQKELETSRNLETTYGSWKHGLCPKVSNQPSKLCGQVRDNLAMEALQLDISKLVPSHSTGSESWSLTAFKKKDKVLTDKRQLGGFTQSKSM